MTTYLWYNGFASYNNMQGISRSESEYEKYEKVYYYRTRNHAIYLRAV